MKLSIVAAAMTAGFLANNAMAQTTALVNDAETLNAIHLKNLRYACGYPMELIANDGFFYIRAGDEAFKVFADISEEVDEYGQYDITVQMDSSIPPFSCIYT